MLGLSYLRGTATVAAHSAALPQHTSYSLLYRPNLIPGVLDGVDMEILE